MRGVAIDAAALERVRSDPRWERVWASVLELAGRHLGAEEGDGARTADMQTPAVIEAAGVHGQE